MVTREQAAKIASSLVTARLGRECPVLAVYEVPDALAEIDPESDEPIVAGERPSYWVVALEYEPGLIPAMLVRVDMSSGEAVQIKDVL